MEADVDVKESALLICELTEAGIIVTGCLERSESKKRKRTEDEVLLEAVVFGVRCEDVVDVDVADVDLDI